MTRVIVIGAGIIGLATAYQLAQRGAEVTVLDRSGVAAGASWGNAGWVCPGLATVSYTHLTLPTILLV